ncbi:CRISPR-associated helicase Cas3' [Raineyella sp. LH-20]|uniref:type I-G CRISPR-associated helicase/endonuclease Cas3g n=1 Tax=Raineyella sp. LH-20 TaxID=3081204 RepID=UPI0029551DBE|nr:CRISPR-associated helicase Cas3' [Raineyella sp. LH-20]WOP20065.1 CRISPR-associated helicase Cas3' [Raineyella sp. LH-20]
MTFEGFFRQATGHPPYDYQARLAEEGLPETLAVPTGAGKTAVILAWLFRLLVRTIPGTARSLVMMLPMRTLVEQTESVAKRWLEHLDLSEKVRVIVLMGGGEAASRDELNEWRRNPQQPTIVIGTVDSVLSRGLLRPYAQPRTVSPIDFASITDDAHWVIDEVQLAPQATSTARQLDAFRHDMQTLHAGRLTCMSATLPEGPLDTIDNPYIPGGGITLSDADRTGPLARRLEATRKIRFLDVSKAADVAVAITEQHRPETLTLAVVNTVDTATDVYKRVRKASPDLDVILLHSRFRGVDRAPRVDHLTDPLPADGRIVISTQVVEAGVDLDATTLFTEVAPWSSICQRAGRCNRAGTTDNAQIFWFGALGKGPYESDDLAASTVALTELEGVEVTSEDLLNRTVDQAEELLTTLRRRDFTRLFDTSPDLSGADIDVSMFIRPSEDTDLTVAWIDPADIVDGHIAEKPRDPWRCSVPISAARKWLEGPKAPTAWSYDPAASSWREVTRASVLKPNSLVLADRNGGGYVHDLGFTPASVAPVTTEARSVTAVEPRFEGASEGPTEDAGSTGQGIGWQLLDDHLEEAGEQAEALLSAVAPPGLSPAVQAAVVAAARFHDLGKAHKDWQEALLNANSSSTGTPPPDGTGPWAKSPGTGRLGFGMSRVRRGFRHELVSIFQLRTDAGLEALTRAGVPEEQHGLSIYLAGAHHGHLRVQPRDPIADGRNGSTLMGLMDHESLPPVTVNGASFPEVEVDLSIFGMGSPESWSRSALDLLDTWGPFRLAWLEMIVRMADWRSSAGDKLPEEG